TNTLTGSWADPSVAPPQIPASPGPTRASRTAQTGPGQALASPTPAAPLSHRAAGPLALWAAGPLAHCPAQPRTARPSPAVVPGSSLSPDSSTARLRIAGRYPSGGMGRVGRVLDRHGLLGPLPRPALLGVGQQHVGALVQRIAHLDAPVASCPPAHAHHHHSGHHRSDPDRPARPPCVGDPAHQRGPQWVTGELNH